jgi:TonB family protein
MHGSNAMNRHAVQGESGWFLSGTHRLRRGRGLVGGLLLAGVLAWTATAHGADDPSKSSTRAGQTSDPGLSDPPSGSQKRDTTERDQAPLNRNPILLKFVPAEYPPEFVGSGLNADVVVTVLVDRMGRVSHIRVEGSPDPAFTDAALEALGQYEFLPAIKNGRVTNTRLQMTLQVREELGDRAFIDFEGGRIELLKVSNATAVDTPVKRIFGPRPAYPIEMLAAGKSGEVVVEFVVGADGIPRGTTIKESTYVEFAHAVQGALALWRYSPALAGARPVATGLRYRVSFQAGEIPAALRTVARRLLDGDHSDMVPAKLLDEQPKVRSRIEPVAPLSATQGDGRTRRAEVVFMVDAKGIVRLPRILKASDPITGYIVLAAVNYWTFDPAVRKKEPVPVLVTMPFRF